MSTTFGQAGHTGGLPGGTRCMASICSQKYRNSVKESSASSLYMFLTFIKEKDI